MIKVHSIFESVSGEVGYIPQGTWSTFIRLQGCNLRCSYCDTKVTQPGQNKEALLMQPEEIINNHVLTNHVTITGGEPLIQRQGVIDLVKAFKKQRPNTVIQIETNGSKKLPKEILNDVGWVIDWKGQSSGMRGKMIPVKTFIGMLPVTDNKAKVITKFVIDFDADDIQHMVKRMVDLVKHGYQFYFGISPVDAQTEKMVQIIQYMCDYMPHEILNHIIFSLQMHKFYKLP